MLNAGHPLSCRRVHARARGMREAAAARFADGERAALAVVAQEHRSQGRCTLPVGTIAVLAGVSESTARNAVRKARQLGLIEIEERAQYRAPHLPNVITINSAAWCAWLEELPQLGSRWNEPLQTLTILAGSER